ncbi:O-antigen flippase Wzx [Mucinivorans hirudinis]|uniref:O-antigen flippase Wzx n=1 Tax=Mucinivorans hirudinis TaxID=1433126 RepID=A0A060R6W2_9BACT|nr:O-antigen flippase Wzx [Mucinivorans hirudinis]
MLSKIKDFILPSDKRGNKIGKNVLWLGGLQGVSILTSFMLVPLTIDYVTTSQYGLWLTISSIVGWFALVDIGLGAGLRNRLTEALSKEDIILAKKLVSTTYFSLAALVVVLFFVFNIINQFIPWATVLNQPESMEALLSKTMYVVVTFFFVRLVVQLIGVVLTAHMLPAAATALSTIGNVVTLAVIWIASKNTEGDLWALSSILSTIPVFIYILASIYFFAGRYSLIRPSFKYFDKTKLRTILGLGFGFFFINISTIILYQTSNILIIQLFNNEEVVVYNVAYKLFSVITIIFGIVIQPFWTGYTDAWVKRDMVWIENTIKKLMVIWKLLTVSGIVLLILSPWLYKIWIGGDVEVPFVLSLLVFLYFSLHCYGGVFNIFINGTGKIRLQMVALGAVALIYVPLALLFVKVFNFGISSLPLALIISNFYSLFVARIQYKRLIKGTAKGIWNR